METFEKQMQDARGLSEQELLDRLGLALRVNAVPGEAPATSAENWLRDRRDWIKTAICENELVDKAFALKDEHAIAYAMALVLLPAGVAAIGPYIWLAWLIVRRGRELWCNDV